MKYTQEQIIFLKSPYKFIFVDAVPGAGKTTLIKEKIKKLLQDKINPKILYITFSIKLTIKIKQESYFDNKNIHISTIHGILVKFLREQLRLDFIIKEKQNSYHNIKIKQLTYTDIEKLTLNNITHFRIWLQKNFQYIFIDEIQDINFNIFNIIMKLIKVDTPYSLYLLGDLNQAIYHHNSKVSEIISRIRSNNIIHTINLNYSFRLGKETCNLIKTIFNYKIITNKRQDQITIIDTKNKSTIFSSLAVLLKHWLKKTTNLAEEYITKKEKLLKTSINTDIKNIVILARYNKTLDKLYSYLLTRNLPVYKIGMLLNKEQRFLKLYQQFLYQNLTQKTIHEIITIPNNLKKLLLSTRLPQMLIKQFLNINSIKQNLELLYIAKKYLKNIELESAINLSTIHKAKGLEFDATILLDLNNNTYNLNKLYDKNLLYVALTRHTKQLIILASPNYIKKLFSKSKKRLNILNGIIKQIPIQQTLL